MVRPSAGRAGQGISTEYVVAFFLIVTALVSMAVYMRRALQGRVADTNHFAISEASRALGSKVNREYEPYYVELDSQHEDRYSDRTRVYGKGAHIKSIDTQKNVSSFSTQLQPGAGK